MSRLMIHARDVKITPNFPKEALLFRTTGEPQPSSQGLLAGGEKDPGNEIGRTLEFCSRVFG